MTTGRSVTPIRRRVVRITLRHYTWVLSTVLADWEGAAGRIRESEHLLSGAGQRVTDKALMRLEAGAPFSVVG